MKWISNHLGSLGHARDFYIPSTGHGLGNGGTSNNKAGAGSEQIKKSRTDNSPRVVETDKYKFPRIQKFFDWEQFLNYADWTGKEWRRASQDKDHKCYKRTLTKSFEEAMNLARYGWHDGLKKLKDMPLVDLPQLQTIKQTYDFQSRYDVAGGAVNIGRYLSGMPDCMRHMQISKMHNLPARVQKIFINGVVNKEITANEILRRGYILFQLIEAMEMANIQTEIIVAFPTNKYNMWFEEDLYVYETYIKIKDATDIIYPEKLLFCLAHPSMLRRLVFSEWERNPRHIRKTFWFQGGTGYGREIPDWRPSENLIGDAMVITNIGDQTELNHIIDNVRDMIQSQYKSTR